MGGGGRGGYRLAHGLLERVVGGSITSVLVNSVHILLQRFC